MGGPATSNAGFWSAIVVGSFGRCGLGVWESGADEAAVGRGVATGDADKAIETKIRYEGVEFGIKEDVGWFDVAMDIFPWAVIVEVSEPTGCGLGNSYSSRPGQTRRRLTRSTCRKDTVHNIRSKKCFGIVIFTARIRLGQLILFGFGNGSQVFGLWQ